MSGLAVGKPASPIALAMKNSDAILLVSFGGPDGPDDVIPFLENVLRGRRVPRERMLQVAQHYDHFGGKSPINDQNRALLAELEKSAARPAGLPCPSIGAIATGIRYWRIPCGRWPATACNACSPL